LMLLFIVVLAHIWYFSSNEFKHTFLMIMGLATVYAGGNASDAVCAVIGVGFILGSFVYR
jgi:hypothetical protein